MDLSALENIETVVVDGRSYDAAALRATHTPKVTRFDGLPARLLGRVIGSAATAYTSSLRAPASPS